MTRFIRVALFAAALAAPAFAADPVKLSLIETVPPEASDNVTSAPGELTLTLEDATIVVSWSEMPAEFTEAGFTVTLTITGHAKASGGGAEPRPVHATFWGDVDTDPSPAWAELILGPGLAGSASQEVKVTPEAGLEDGQVVEIRVGTDLGPTTLYRYKVSKGS